ncbi:MAG: ABC transporter substrate-binding protein [Butyrivibrio sp.]|nr:ABC transporter substrate-binding protein [Muribaculum sp.]MCM1553749.1 ABC transporter substrate-binding protein [Butyrivibrio sp.]
MKESNQRENQGENQLKRQICQLVRTLRKVSKRSKIAALVIAATLGLSLLSGCGAAENAAPFSDTTIRIGALKGPTSMGLLFLMNDEAVNQSGINYEFQMATAADELLPLMVKGDLDIALVPANVASILYAKTEGGVSVIDVNTLGVLYMVSGDDSYQNITDLAGKTIYLTGKGTTPDYVLQYVLAENGLAAGDYTLEYKSEATEVAAVLAQQPDAIGLLPQPFVTAACAQNETLQVVFDMNEEWNKVQGHGMVTGVTVVRNAFLQENEEAVRAFLGEHAASAKAINDDPETGAKYAVEAGIVAKEPIAQKAIPECNITCVTGEEMKNAVSGYLEVLYSQSPESVGGALPEDKFYFREQ